MLFKNINMAENNYASKTLRMALLFDSKIVLQKIIIGKWEDMGLCIYF